MQIAQFSLQGLMPSQDSPAYAVPNPVQMPWGGVTGTGGPFEQGAAITCVAGTIQSEVITVTIAGSTGTLVFTFTSGNGIQQAKWLVGASLATAQTALEAIFGVGNITVTGTPGTTYTITFSGNSANHRIGGLAAVSATTAGTPTVARTTRGSSGAGQYDLYDGSTYTIVNGFLEYGFNSDPQGCVVTNIPSSGQPSSMPAWTRGRFFVDQLGSNFDAAAISSNTNIVFVRGTAITDVGAQIELL